MHKHRVAQDMPGDTRLSTTQLVHELLQQPRQFRYFAECERLRFMLKQAGQYGQQAIPASSCRHD